MTDLSPFIIPRGFRFGAIKAGVKASGRTDFSLIVADTQASAAAAFTANRVIAAPLIVDKKHLTASKGKVRVVAINAGNANCAAGQAGLDAAIATCAAAARIFSCRPDEVFPSSTGVIGVPLPAQKLIDVMPTLAASLGTESDRFLEVAHAILTTDTVEKTAFARIEVAGPDGALQEIRIAALGKGSGMIHPQLVPHATMLIYILTDAAIEPAVLDSYLRPAIEVSFNRISVDGDTSTNDTVLLLASGASGVSIGPSNAAFASALTQVCTSMAHQVVADGEGLTHLVELRIEGAASDADALRVAKAIAHSPLGQNRLGWQRSQLGPPRRRHRLLRRADRSRSLRHLVWRAPHLPQRRPRPRVRRGHCPRLRQPERILRLHPSPPGPGQLRLLDHRPHA